MRPLRLAWALALAGLALAPVVATQAPPRFTAGVQMVEVYVTVTDADGGLVRDLQQDDFEIYEDEELQEIATFAAGEVPLSVALGVDRSASMAGDSLRLAKLASRAFLRALKPSDRSMVVAISSETDVIAALSTDRPTQVRAVDALDAWSTTALHDAIANTLAILEPEPGRLALVVFSDGADRFSQLSAAEVLDRARRSSALVYPIAIGDVRPPLLAELAVLTGGRSFLLRTAAELEATLGAIAAEFRYQYLLGYVPRDRGPRGGGWRSIRVGLDTDHRGLRVRARDGYLAD